MDHLPPPEPDTYPHRVCERPTNYVRQPHPFVAWVGRFPHWPAWQLVPAALVAFVLMLVIYAALS